MQHMQASTGLMLFNLGLGSDSRSPPPCAALCAAGALTLGSFDVAAALNVVDAELREAVIGTGSLALGTRLEAEGSQGRILPCKPAAVPLPMKCARCLLLQVRQQWAWWSVAGWTVHWKTSWCWQWPQQQPMHQCSTCHSGDLDPRHPLGLVEQLSCAQDTHPSSSCMVPCHSSMPVPCAMLPCLFMLFSEF